MDPAVMLTLLRRFEERRESMLREGHEGLFVAFTERGEAGFFVTEEEAVRAANFAFGPGPTLVKRIERTHAVHRDPSAGCDEPMSVARDRLR
jgi:hypothetical protein